MNNSNGKVIISIDWDKNDRVWIQINLEMALAGIR